MNLPMPKLQCYGMVYEVVDGGGRETDSHVHDVSFGFPDHPRWSRTPNISAQGHTLLNHICDLNACLSLPPNTDHKKRNEPSSTKIRRFRLPNAAPWPNPVYDTDPDFPQDAAALATTPPHAVKGQPYSTVTSSSRLPHPVQ